MHKIKLVVLFIVFLSLFPIFSSFASEDNSIAKNRLEELDKGENGEEMQDTDKLVNYEQDKAEKKAQKKRINQMKKNLDPAGIVKILQSYIEDFMFNIETVLLSPFQNATPYKNVKNVFRILVSIFLIVSCFYFVVQIVSDPHFQASEIPLLFFEMCFCIYCILVFSLRCPYIKKFYVENSRDNM